MTLGDTAEAPSDVTAYSATRLHELRELAYALTGDPRQAAARARAALVRAGGRRSRIRRAPDQDLAVIAILVRRYLADSRAQVIVDQRPTEAETAADRAKPAPAIAQLTGLMRAVLALRYVSGLSDSEIAATVKASRGAVRSRAARGLAQLTAAGLLPPGPDSDRELIHRLLVPPGSLPPTDPAESVAITAEVRRHRRRQTLTAAGLAAVAAGGVVAAILLGPGLWPLHRGADPAAVILTRPQASGSIPEPVVKPVPDLDGLGAALPGMSLTSLDLGRFQIRGMALTGTLLGSSGTGRNTRVAEFDPATGTETELARAELPFVDYAAGDESTVVWMEAEHERVEGGFRQRNLTLRCLDRSTGAVDTIAVPRSDPRGVPYPDTGSALLTLAVGSSGRIVLAVGGFSDGAVPSQSSDLYLARRCGEPLVLLAEVARSPRFVGDELYYLGFDGVQEGIWRQRIGDSGPAGAPRQVAAPASTYLTTGDAIVWDARKYPGFASSGAPDLRVARLDGSGARSVPAIGDLEFAGAARTGLAGQISDPDSGRYRGLWMYLPSWGAILTMGLADDGSDAGLLFRETGGNAFVVTEYGEDGSTGNAWLLRLP
ncbi:MAG TPA: sigma factor-like helix-turn-helix DNA-binding protein [Actinomycetes bacterium]|nr:sigma factor-like helix-turn-helix DNA-binding protein [Actinomycetes bacterium]